MIAPGLANEHQVVPSRLVRARDALSFEWTKLRSIRSNYLTLLIGAVATIGGTAVVAESLSVAPVLRAGGPLDALTASFLSYAEYGVLPLSILGVLVFTSEYSSGMIWATFIAVPRRGAVLAAKAAVAGAAALVIGELLAFTCFWLTQAIVSGDHGGLSLSGPGVLPSVLAAGCFMPACVLVGLGLGAVLRHTAGAIAATVAVIYLLAVLCLVLPTPWDTRLGKFTLLFAADQLVTPRPHPSLLSPGLSLLVIVAWPAVALVAGALVISRRDV
jgi:ABC-2 type transport system permease protein